MTRTALAALLGASLVTGVAHAAEAKLPAELLEFLGSLDSEDPEWHDYLASTNVKKLLKPPVTPVASDKNQDEAKP
ncbi:MAG: hypothetical protein ABIT36_01560 [Steroidobacteraceae bacterium]